MRATLLLSAFPLLSVSAISAESFSAANGLERSLVAEQPLLRNPVSVSMDVDGTIYVTETARRKEADLDIREFVKFGWVPRDVSHTSIEDKRAFFQKQLDGKNDFKGTSLKDQNKDGKIDVKDLTAISEKIIRLTDKDGDGVYDTSNVFAEGFNTEVTGIAAGTLAWRGDVYATIAPDVWKLRDTTGDGKADKRESLAHGFGIHIAYAGHDMHGLILGPDGKLYWSIGDKGTNVTDRDGKNHYAPHEGAVLRCNPDGTGFEIFARGLRNPQEIAFDKYGNLFSVDNDSDQKGERERFLHITEGSDTGWRNYYQYRGSAYNPWMAESIWEPTGKYQPAYITPTSGNYTDGPSGFAYNPGTALNAKYADAFFVTEFPKGNLLSFTVKPKGASFEIAQSHTVLSGPMNVGINFGPDGALYSADWAGGYPLNEKGAVWRLDDPKESASDLRKEVSAMLKAGAKDVPTTDLVKRLSHADMRVRTDAQWELAERNAIAELHEVVTSEKSGQLARIHAVWALSQDGRFFEKAFHSLAASDDPELRAQAAKHAGETMKGANPILTKMLADESPRVRFHAATAIWKTGDATAIDAVIKMLAENDNKDAYLRHAGVMALTTFPPELLESAISHESPAVRLAAAVAFRRLSSPLAAKLLSDADPKVVAEAAHAIFDDPPITAAYPALADLIRKNPDATVPAARRSIAANRYLADAESAERLADFAADDSVETSLRIAALEALASWTQASEPNPVDGRHDPLKPADAAIAKAAFAPMLAKLQLLSDLAITEMTAEVVKNLGIVGSVGELKKLLLDGEADPSARLRALADLNVNHREIFSEIFPRLLYDNAPAIRAEAASLLAGKDPVAVIKYSRRALTPEHFNSSEAQKIITILGKMDHPDAKRFLAEIVEKALRSDPMKPMAIPPYWPEITIELEEAVSPDQAARLQTLISSSRDKIPYLRSTWGGDSTAGEKIFNEHLAAQCTACHRIGDEGSDVGPPLGKIGQNLSDWLILKSLIDPNDRIAPGYGMMSVKMKDGSTFAGALKQEDKKFLSLILPDKKEVVINLAEVESRTAPISTMPPMGAILTPRQLRDLVEYLSGLKG